MLGFSLLGSSIIGFTTLSMPSQRTALIAYHCREDNPKINPALGISSEFETLPPCRRGFFPLPA
ncbi:hypothetical protein GFS31_28160 [Leptolyngbya sp. BL0902]|nr:hypothetical protein GFS31_28160 [Leptolyngbya sp. BL0902]